MDIVEDKDNVQDLKSEVVITDDDIIESMLTPKPPSKAPDIDHLEDAIVDGLFTLGRGDTLTIERWFRQSEKTYWMGTNTYEIKEVHENGDLVLTDLNGLQGAMSNWKTAPKRGYRFKGAPKAIARDIKRKRRRKGDEQ